MRAELFLIAALASAQSFDYNRLPARVTDSGVEVRDIAFSNLRGGATRAYLVRPARKNTKAPGILWVHWYEPESHDSNRSQFLGQALELAHSGAVSLLVETMWSNPDWFDKRNRDDDYQASVDTVKDLRRALDILLAQPGVDPARVAYVGHDFGAMYGALLASADRRVSAWALQAGTASFSDWFLLGAKLSEPARQAVIDRLAPLDPLRHIAHASPLFLQFGTKDPYVPKARADALYQAAKDPKQVKFYEAGHALNAQAVADRQQWLRERLALH